jgi:acetylornithine deacetylase/succinyl-diaminopimelate desuccinylase-like protein
MLTEVLTTIDASRDQNLRDLIDFLKIPSVSTNPDHADDCRLCANFLASHLTKLGLRAEILPTGGHPVVLAKNTHLPTRPTVLVYGHYDVQPPEPLDQWLSPPFEPAVRDGAIFARGTCDDKGQVWCHVAALAAWQQQGGPPVNLTLLFEGEEEIGSRNLKSFVQKYKDQLTADVAVISDTNQFTRGLPAITYGLRGLVYMELALTGPSHDLHSGLYGGAVPNPANILCQILASLHNPDGSVNIPNFYDDVLPISPEERDAWKQLPWDESAFCKELGIPHGNGEAGYTSIERKWARPTLDINGLTAGYQGKGAKTVIPSLATAKVSMRLVPNQDPLKIAAAFEKAVRAKLPDNCKLETSLHSSSGPVLTPITTPAMQAAVKATQTGFNTQQVALMREGGSIPVVLLLKQQLNLDTLMVGFGLDDDRIHSPNEKFELDALHHGTRTCAALYHELSTLKP